MKTPNLVVDELDEVRHRMATTAEEIRDAEASAVEAERIYKRELATAYRRAQGTAKDREGTALIECERFAEARDAAKAVAAYVKTRRANLEIEQSNLQTQSRLVELVFRGPVVR